MSIRNIMKKIDYHSQHFMELNQIDLVNLNGGGFFKWLFGNIAWEAVKSITVDAPIREGSVPDQEMSGGYYVMPSDNA
jgi:hypothetical protein